MDDQETEAKIEALMREHGEIAVFRTLLGVCIFKPPTSEAYQRFIEKTDKANKDATMRELALACLVHPSPDEAKTIFRRYTVLPLKVANRLLELGGSDIEGEVKKA